MATVLLVNKRGEGVPVALRLAQQEGHIVKLYSTEGHSNCLSGYRNPSFISNPKRMAEQYDLAMQTTSFGERMLNDREYYSKVVNILLPLPSADEYEGKDGIEVLLEGFFTGEHWSNLFTLSLNTLRLMDGDRGVVTPGMGGVSMILKEGKLTTLLLNPFTELLQKVSYTGPFSIGALLKEDQAYLKGVYPYYNYNTLPQTCELLKESLFTLLYQLTLDQAHKIPVWDSTYSLSVRLSLSPWPLNADYSSLKGQEVLNTPKEAKPHVWLRDVMKEDEIEKVAGVDGTLAFVTARGGSIREAQRRVYRTINNIVMSKDVQYRSDVGEDFEACEARLKEEGWLN